MQVKTCPARVKVAGTNEGTDEGVFEAIVATYDVDSVGDRIIPGAFGKTLEQWKATGDPIPVIWSHKSDDPNYHVGEVLEAEERPEGLWVKARIDLDEPVSAKVYKLLKGRRITQFSFAYDEVDARPSEKAETGATKDLHELKVYEVGPCMIGANQRTSLLGVKHDQPFMTVDEARERMGFPPVVGELKTGVQTGARVEIGGDGAVRMYPAEKAAEKISDTAAELKAGRTLSKQNEDRVAEIARLASELLSSVKSEANATGETGGESNAEKAAPTAPAVAEESQAAPEAAPESKSDEPAVSGVARERLRTELDLLELDSYAI
jgi:HK97 family phage prohead protease